MPGSSAGHGPLRPSSAAFLPPGLPRLGAAPGAVRVAACGARQPLTPQGAQQRVVLEVSRLLSSVRRGPPSGIDRVEMPYTRHWLAAPAAGRGFVAQGLF